MLLLIIFLSSLLAAASRWAQLWLWVGSAPRKQWTGASSGTSSWRGLSRCLWPACSAPPSWPCLSTASCPTSEGATPGGRAEEEKESRGERERGGGEAWVDVISRMCGLQMEEKEESRRTRVTRKKGGWFTGGLGCTVDVRRVGSHAAWLRSPEIFLTHLSSQSVFIYSLSFWWD